MKNNPNIPNELYYLDDNFNISLTRKYQLKEILAANNIPHDSVTTRADLVVLFKEHVVPRREEILQEYKLKESKQKEQEANTVFGRGHRATQRPLKFENDVFKSTRRTRKSSDSETRSRSSHKKDKDGFAIPAVPEKKRKRRTAVTKKPTFTAEDSFGEEEGEEEKKSTIKDDGEITFKLPKIEDTPIKQRSTRAVNKSKTPSFNPEDSFASSDDTGKKRQVRKRNVRQRASKIMKKEEFSLDDHSTVDDQLKKIEQHAAVDDDSNYEADSDNDDELSSLQKDQRASVESLIEPSSQPLDNSVVLWNNFLKNNNTLVYVAAGVIILIIYLCTSLPQSP